MEFDFSGLENNYAAYLPADKDACILEVGCGFGRVLSYLKSKGYRNLTAFDRNAQAVDSVRQHLLPDVYLEHDSARFLESRKGLYDLIVAKDVIYYFPKPTVAREMKALLGALKPGGVLILEVFNGAALTGAYIQQKDFYIEWVPTEYSVRTILEEAGFEVGTIEAFVPSAKGLKQRIFNLASALWRAALRAAYFLERGLDPQNPKILTTKLIATAKRPAPGRS